MIRKTFALLLLAIALIAGPADARRRAVVRIPETNLTTEEWLKRHAHAFETEHPRSGLDDLHFLPSIVRNARIVSLGENTHGTREFFLMKHRVFEYLVETMGFTVFGIEAALPQCDAINDYVLHGIGDPSAALAGQGFWTWNTDEVFDLVLWMREYNLRRGERPPVSFRGFDMQRSDVAIQKARAYLQRIDPAGASAITSQWSCFEPYSDNSPAWLNQPANTITSCVPKLAAAYATFESRRDDYIARSSVAEYETYLHYARVIVQHEGLAQRAGGGGGAFRDAAMAENVVRLANVRHPGEKLVLWAHNYHVGRSGVNTMGWHLREIFPPEEMVVFGFAFDRGSFNARPLSTLGAPVPHTVGPWPTDYEAMLRTAGRPRYVVDLRNIESTAARTFFGGFRTLWAIGSVFSATVDPSGFRERISLRDTYDAIIWIEETTASRLRPF